MKLPAQPFQKKSYRTAENSYSQSNLKNLQTHIEYLKTLTQLILPILTEVLPQQEGAPRVSWQVAALDGDVLCIATEHHTAGSQLKYLQHQVIKSLQQHPEFAAVRHLKIVIEVQPKPKTISHGRLPALSPEVKQILDDAASAFQDTDISDTLRRLARERR
ncbi:hypothetical protein [Aquirhabdus sp.]|uniref:hypothetical protein n=1 Tax=Aquirhabdus sp. TaxID=2824160 RepID=UPI00396C9A28